MMCNYCGWTRMLTNMNWWFLWPVQVLAMIVDTMEYAPYSTGAKYCSACKIYMKILSDIRYSFIDFNLILLVAFCLHSCACGVLKRINFLVIPCLGKNTNSISISI